MAFTKLSCVKAAATAVIVALPLASTAAVGPLRTQVAQRSAACPYAGMTLGPALAPFALMAATTITNVGNTIVTYSAKKDANDLVGVWPGTAITGFYPPGLDAGGPNAIYAAGYNANRGVPEAAQGALLTAYNTAAALRPNALVSGDLSQVKLPGYPIGTLTPGVYKSNSTLGIMAGNLTLSPGRSVLPPIFVFQVASSFTTTGSGGVGGNIILERGVSPCNIYFEVGDSATLNGQSFYGNVFAYSSITLGATYFTGRALAMNGAITITSAGGTLITNSGGW